MRDSWTIHQVPVTIWHQEPISRLGRLQTPWLVKQAASMCIKTCPLRLLLVARGKLSSNLMLKPGEIYFNLSAKQWQRQWAQPAAFDQEENEPGIALLLIKFLSTSEVPLHVPIIMLPQWLPKALRLWYLPSSTPSKTKEAQGYSLPKGCPRQISTGTCSGVEASKDSPGPEEAEAHDPLKHSSQLL